MKGLRREAATAAGWSGGASAAVALIQLAQLALLARLVPPGEFGAMAMAMVFVGLAQPFADLGVSAALIRRRDTTESQRSSLYWLNVLLGLGLAALLWVASPWVGAFYGEPRVVPVLRWLSASFVLVAVGQQFRVLLERELEFRRLGVVEVAAAAVGATAAIATALRGGGVMALVAGQLAGAATRSLWLAAAGWRRFRPRFELRLADLGPYLRFGGYQMGERIVNYFNQRVDQLLIGRIAGAEALGLYSFAFLLCMQPLQRINPILMRVALPVLSRVQDDRDKLRTGYFTLRRVLALTNTPLQLGLAAVAPVLVPGLFGERWLPAVPLVVLLAGVGLLRSLGNPVGSLLLARGRADLGFGWNLALLVVQFPVILAGTLVGGALGAAAANLALQAVCLLAEYPLLVRRLVGPCLGGYWRTAWPSLWVGAVMLVAVRALVPGTAWAWPATLAVQLATGALVYAALHASFHRADAVRLLADLRG